MGRRGSAVPLNVLYPIPFYIYCSQASILSSLVSYSTSSLVLLTLSLEENKYLLELICCLCSLHSSFQVEILVPWVEGFGLGNSPVSSLLNLLLSFYGSCLILFDPYNLIWTARIPLDVIGVVYSWKHEHVY